MINHEVPTTWLEQLHAYDIQCSADILKLIHRLKAKAESAKLLTEIKFIKGNSVNFFIRMKGSDPLYPSMILNSNLYAGFNDGLEAAKPASFFEEREGKIFGRGIAGSKSAAAAMIQALAYLKTANTPLKGDVTFIGTTDKCGEYLGTKAVLGDDAFDQAKAIVIGKPTDGEVIIAHKGLICMDITTFGKKAPGANPQQGINAVVQMNKVIEFLNAFSFEDTGSELVGKPSLNISTIIGGTERDSVPDQCTVTVEIRTVPPMDHRKVIHEIRDKISSALSVYDFEIVVTNDLPYISGSLTDPFTRLTLKTNEQIRGFYFPPQGTGYHSSESTFLSASGIPIIIYGPGHEKLAYHPEEYIEKDSYIQAVKFYFQLIKNFNRI